MQSKPLYVALQQCPMDFKWEKYLLQENAHVMKSLGLPLFVVTFVSHVFPGDMS